MFSPFDTGGVTETTGLGTTGDVWDFPAPLAQGVEGCEEPTGLRKKQRHRLVIYLPNRKVVWGKGAWAQSICCSAADSAQSWQHLGLACMCRKTERSDYDWWLSHLEEQQVQASCGTSGCRDGPDQSREVRRENPKEHMHTMTDDTKGFGNEWTENRNVLILLCFFGDRFKLRPPVCRWLLFWRCWGQTNAWQLLHHINEPPTAQYLFLFALR